MIDTSSQREWMYSGISVSPLDACFLKIHSQKEERVAFKKKKPTDEENQAER